MARGTAAETVEKHAKIVALKLSYWTWAEIASEVEMSVSGVRIAYYKWRDADKLDLAQEMSENPLDLIHEHIAGFRMIAKELFKCARDATNESAKVGALRAAAELRSKEIDLMQAVGMLPKNLGRFAIDIDMRYIEAKLVDLIAGLPLTDQDREDFAESIVEALNPGAKIVASTLQLAAGDAKD